MACRSSRPDLGSWEYLRPTAGGSILASGREHPVAARTSSASVTTSDARAPRSRSYTASAAELLVDDRPPALCRALPRVLLPRREVANPLHQPIRTAVDA